MIQINGLMEKLQIRYTCTRDKLSKNINLAKSHVDEEIKKEVGNAVQNLIRKSFEEKVKENTQGLF